MGLDEVFYSVGRKKAAVKSLCAGRHVPYRQLALVLHQGVAACCTASAVPKVAI